MGRVEILEAVDVGHDDENVGVVAAPLHDSAASSDAIDLRGEGDAATATAVAGVERDESAESGDESNEEVGEMPKMRKMVGHHAKRSLSSAIGIKPTKRGSHKRTLSHRIRQLQEAEDELRLYQRMVSKSLDDLGMDAHAFDERVERHSRVQLEEVHSASFYTTQERLSLAAALAKLAVLRIDPGSIAWDKPFSRTLFLVAHAPSWRLYVQLLIALYVLITYFEAPVTHGTPGTSGTQPWPWWLMVLEGLCASGYVADVAINFGYERWEAILQHRHHHVRAAIALACATDYVLALVITLASGGVVGYLRWSRPVRVLYLPFTNKACFNSVLSILDTLPSLGDLLLLGLVTTFVYSIVGVTIFAAEGLRGPPYQGDDSNAFDRVDLAFVSLSTLMTGENYPSVMWPALNMHPASLTYFLVFVFVGTIIVMPAIVAIVFDYYKRFHGLKVLEEKVVERRCLLMAFALVDQDNSGAISVPEFGKLISAVHPNGSATERSVLYKLLDADSDNMVTASEFIRLSDALLLDVREQTHDVTRLLPCLRRRAQRVRALTDSEWFEHALQAVLAAYVVVLAMQVHPATAARISDGAALAFDATFVCVFSAEVVLKAVALSPAAFWESVRNRIDAGMALCSALVFVARVVLIGAFGAAPADEGVASALRVLEVGRTARTLFVFTHSHKLRVLTTMFAQMRPVVGTILGTILMVFYFYLIIGMEAFHGRIVWDEGTASSCLAWCPSFDTMVLTSVTLLQLLLSANWQEVVYVLDGSGGRFVTWTYLITFVLLTNAIMLSLLAALVLEIYSVETERRVHKSKVKDSQLAKLFPQDALRGDKERGGVVSAERYVVVLSSGVRAMFERYDVDGSGTISTLELSNLLQDLGESLSKAELRKVLAKLDVDANGQVSFAEFISWWQRHGLEKVFLKFDADGSGAIDARELGELMKSIGSPMEGDELDAALRELDQDGSGSIGFDEYESWFADYDVRKVFASFDTDGSGTISKTELEAILAHMGIELTRTELREAVARLDADHNGHISFVEFLPWWREVSKLKEAKTFTVENDRSRKWEEQLFLRRKASNGLMKLFDDADSAQMRPDALRELMRTIAADFAAGKALTEEYLMAAYGKAPLSTRSDPAAAGGSGAEPGAPADERTVHFAASARCGSSGSGSALLAPLGALSPGRRSAGNWGGGASSPERPSAGSGTTDGGSGKNALAAHGFPAVLQFRHQSAKGTAAGGGGNGNGSSPKRSTSPKRTSAGSASIGADSGGAAPPPSGAQYKRSKVQPEPASTAPAPPPPKAEQQAGEKSSDA